MPSHSETGFCPSIGTSFQQTADGGYIVFGAGTDCSTVYTYGLIMKIDINGNIEWQKKYGTSNAIQWFAFAQQTTDGG